MGIGFVRSPKLYADYFKYPPGIPFHDQGKSISIRLDIRNEKNLKENQEN
jgi:hypothetical protein